MTTKQKEVLGFLSLGFYLYPKMGVRDTWESHAKQFETSGSVLRPLYRKGWITIFDLSGMVTITGDGKKTLLETSTE
jgi:hypothetical protein